MAEILRRLGIVILIAISLGVALRASKAQWENSDPAIRRWYQTLMQPDNPGMSCCGKSDAYWADKVEVVGDKVYAVITDDRPDAPLGRRHIPIGTRFLVPPHKIKYDRGNPTGHVVIFISLTDEVYCYVQGTGI